MSDPERFVTFGALREIAAGGGPGAAKAEAMIASAEAVARRHNMPIDDTACVAPDIDCLGPNPVFADAGL